MIELVSESRCIACQVCVKVCPTNVFDKGHDGLPVIARKDDCQTCFLCEAYCPTDALFVAPEADAERGVSETALASAGLLGSYREALGWGKDRQPTASLDGSYRMFRAMRE